MLEPFNGFSSIFLESDARESVRTPLCQAGCESVLVPFWRGFSWCVGIRRRRQRS